MKKILTWYKNLKLSIRVIFSMNMAILISILIISVFAARNRINVQKRDASAMVWNELNQATNLLGFLQDRPIEDLQDIIKSRVLYETGFISIVSSNGDVLICRARMGENISGEKFFTQMKTKTKGEYIFSDSKSKETYYLYHTYFEPLDVYVVATLLKKEFLDKHVANTLMILVFALIFTWITFSIANYFIMKTVTTPLNGLVKVVRELGKGSLTNTYDYNSRDEVGQITQSVNDLIVGLQQTTIFANEIGKNNFEHPFKPLSDKDVLGNSLLEMRQSLKTANEDEKIRKVEDEKRNWSTQGLAKFAEILRHNNDSIHELSYNIIRNLVEYLEINQGGIFILNDDESKDIFLELTACYAFDRRKYLEKKIMVGEGLVGTCFLEKEPIYITNIPQDYIRITSGLGDENPSSLLLIPLKLNEKVFGVIELASFHPFEQHKLVFVEKIGESIASTISSVKINTQTAMLLQKSQQQAEEMKAQEEEMRQNMEELAATQEAMAEKERENLETIANLTTENNQQIAKIKAKEKEILDTLEDCPEGVVKSNQSGEIILINKAAEKLWGYKKNEVLGKNVKMLMPSQMAHNHDAFMAHYISTGEKKIIGTGRSVDILLKSGETHPVFLTIVETRIGEDLFFTGFFTDLIKFKGAESATKSPVFAPNQTGSIPSAPVKQSFSDENDSNTHQAASKDNDIVDNIDETEAETHSEPGNLHQGDVTDNQKAWTEHITQKGKAFRKPKKK
jgi:PAS domain S-box-containing protein